MNNQCTRSLITIFLALLVASFGKAAESLAIGPVDTSSCANGELRVMGYSFFVDNACSLNSLSSVRLIGNLSADGSYTVDGAELSGTYRPGADIALIRGVVTAVDSRAGTARIGGTVVDYTALLADREFAGLQVGEKVEISGIQPVLRGELIAVSGIIGVGSQAAGIIGVGNKTSGIIGVGSQAAGIIGVGNKTSGIIGVGSQAAGIIGVGNKTSGIIGVGY